jgi:hypothetical protein
MSPRCHIAFRGLACCDIDDVAEEVGLAVLATEILSLSAASLGVNIEPEKQMAVKKAERKWRDGKGREERQTNTTNYILMITQMCLAVLAAVDLVAAQIDVVCQAHDHDLYLHSSSVGNESPRSDTDDALPLMSPLCAVCRISCKS